MGWLRTEVVGQRCRVVMCFNPPCTAEGRWVLAYFGPWIDPKHPRPATPGELRWYVTGPDGKEVECVDNSPVVVGGKTLTPKSRTFIPARVTDNPYYVRTNYVAQLQALPEPLRSLGKDKPGSSFAQLFRLIATHVATHETGQHVGGDVAQSSQCLRPILTRHANIEQHHCDGRLVLLVQSERLATTGCQPQLKAVLFQP
jgi:hypothetical protein